MAGGNARRATAMAVSNMNADEFAVLVNGLSHHYGERKALDGLSFGVRPGEIFALLGPNGSGKTTLFRVLSTLVAPQAGRVFIGGEDIQTATARVPLLLGVVFQSPSVDRKLTVQENLFHQAALYGLAIDKYRRRSDLLLEQMGLKDRRHDLVEKLSGGLRRRVELAKGMLHGPRVLLMDEPSSGLDPGAK